MLPILFELLQVATLSRQLPGSGSDAVNGVYVDHDYVLVSLFTMSIPFSGRVTRSGGLMSAIGKQLKSLNLKPVKRIDFRFDPFHEKVTPARLVPSPEVAAKVAMSDGNYAGITNIVIVISTFLLKLYNVSPILSLRL